MLTASGYEQLAAVTAGAIVAVGGFVLAGARPPLVALVLFAVLCVAALAVRPAWLGDRIARWAARRGVTIAGPLRQRTLGLMVAIDVAGWAATAAGVALLATGLLGAAAPGVFVLLGAFALSWVAGVLLPLLPAGLGPRDAVLVVGLTGAIGAGAAASLALALRVVSFAGELVAIAVAELVALVLVRRRAGRRRRRRQPPRRSPPPPRRPRRIAIRARSSSSRRTTSSSRCRCFSSASSRPASSC